MKQCSKCEKQLPSTEYYKGRATCKACYALNRARYFKTEKGREIKRNYINMRRKCPIERNKDRVRQITRKQFGNASYCEHESEACSDKFEWHHIDYNEPINAIQLCRAHHKLVHSTMDE